VPEPECLNPLFALSLTILVGRAALIATVSDFKRCTIMCLDCQIKIKVPFNIHVTYWFVVHTRQSFRPSPCSAPASYFTESDCVHVSWRYVFSISCMIKSYIASQTCTWTKELGWLGNGKCYCCWHVMWVFTERKLRELYSLHVGLKIWTFLNVLKWIDWVSLPPPPSSISAVAVYSDMSG
jgi:hypothetical protein